MNKKEIKNILILMGLVLIIALFVYLPFIQNKIPFELSTIDTREQIYPFYVEFTKLMDNFFKHGTLPFYSWSNFLGNGFLISKAFYLTTDYTMYIAYFLKLYFWDAMMFTTIFKLLVSAFSMYLLLSSFKFKPTTKIIGALCYTFSAQMGYYTVYPMYLNIYSLLPLYFLGIERFIRFNKKYLFIFMTAILCISHTYLFYIVSFFTVIYYVYRYAIEKDSMKKFFRDTAKIIAYYGIGLLLAGVIFIPFASFILSNDRVGLMNNNLIYSDIRTYTNIISSLLMPYHVFQTIPYPFRTDSYTINEVFLWSGTLFSLLIPQFIFLKNKKIKVATAILYTVLLCFYCVPILNSIMHGFSENSFRSSILLCLINIVICSSYLDKKEDINWKGLWITGTIYIVFIIFIMLVTSEFNLFILFNNYGSYSLTIGFTIIMILLFIILFKNKHKTISLIVVGVVLVDLAIPLYYETKQVPNDPNRYSYDFMNKASSVLEYQENGLKNYLNGLEDGNNSEYFRIYVDRGSLFWDLSMNSSMFYGINGLSTYDTTHATSLNKLKELAPEMILADSKEFDRFLSIEDYELMTYLNTKYALVTNESQLPEGKWELIDGSYLDFVQVYKNLEYRPLGTSYSTVLNYNEFDGNYQELFTTVYCNPKDLTEIQNLLGNTTTVLSNVTYTGNSLLASYESSDDTFMVITIPYDDGWKVYVNGIETKKYPVNGGFIGLAIPSGNNFIEMHYMPSGLKLGVISTSLGVVILFVLVIVDIRKKVKGNK